MLIQTDFRILNFLVNLLEVKIERNKMQTYKFKYAKDFEAGVWICWGAEDP